MDLFKYTASVAELNKCKSVSKAEQLCRTYCERAKNTTMCSYWNRGDTDYLTQKFLYKLLTLALNKHKELSKATLPDFIHKTKRDAHEYILRSILIRNHDIQSRFNTSEFCKHKTYKEFMDIFEFDSLITLPCSTYYVEELDSIIADNPVHFTVKWNNSRTSFDSYSTKLKERTQNYAYALRYKQVNFPNKPRTIWDQFLSDMESANKAVSEEDINESITKLKQHIRALNTIRESL